VTINLVMTDNGSGYRSDFFLTTCKRLWAKPIEPKPYTPRTNGKAERLIQTSLIIEWAYKQTYESSAEREPTFLPWLHDYNYRRSRASLKNRQPVSRITNCEQPFY
jgi:transposase InsO family protein